MLYINEVVNDMYDWAKNLWMIEWMIERIIERMNERLFKRINKWINECVRINKLINDWKTKLIIDWLNDFENVRMNEC